MRQPLHKVTTSRSWIAHGNTYCFGALRERAVVRQKPPLSCHARRAATSCKYVNVVGIDACHRLSRTTTRPTYLAEQPEVLLTRLPCMRSESASLTVVR